MLHRHVCLSVMFSFMRHVRAISESGMCLAPLLLAAAAAVVDLMN